MSVRVHRAVLSWLLFSSICMSFPEQLLSRALGSAALAMSEL